MQKKNKDTNLDELLTVREIEKYLKMGRAAVINLIHQGKLPDRKIGRGYRVRKTDLIEFVNN